MWRLAERSGGLDLNTPYAYVLWCRDFARTSSVVELDGEVAGYVTGYRRPDAPDTLFVWQITVATEARGLGLAGRLLDGLVERLSEEGLGWLEATVTPDNEASRRTFAALATRHGADITTAPLFESRQFPIPHDPELLVRVGPLR